MNNTGNRKYFLNTFDTTQVLVYRFNSAHDSLVPVLTQHMSVKTRGESVSYIGTQNIYVTYADQGSSLKWGYIAIDPRGKTMRLFSKGSSTSDVARVSYEKMFVAGTGTLTLINPSTNTVTGTQSTTLSLSSIPLIPINLVWNWDLTPRTYYYRLVHKKQFEMKDHLGNVRVIVSDCKNPETANIYTANKTAEIQNINNYYSFGMPMHRRNYTSANGSYRFGFNGKEKDDEVKGEGVQYDYGFRIYDSRLGRFLSVDPLTKSYPWYTPYQFAGNKPIWNIDLDGLEDYNYLENFSKSMFESAIKYVQATTIQAILNVGTSVVMQTKDALIEKYEVVATANFKAKITCGARYAFEVKKIAGVDIDFGSASLIEVNGSVNLRTGEYDMNLIWIDKGTTISKKIGGAIPLEEIGVPFSINGEYSFEEALGKGGAVQKSTEAVKAGIGVGLVGASVYNESVKDEETKSNSNEAGVQASGGYAIGAGFVFDISVDIKVGVKKTDE